MTVAAILEKMMKMANVDPLVKEELMRTRDAEDPVEEFCRYVRSKGFELYEVELIMAGEELNNKIRRCTNGGGENAPQLEGEDDFYEMFFASISE